MGMSHLDGRCSGSEKRIRAWEAPRSQRTSVLISVTVLISCPEDMLSMRLTSRGSAS